MRHVVKGSLALGALVASTVVVVPARADEAKTPVSAFMILEMVSRPVERPGSAFDQSLREDRPAAPPSSLGEVLSGGSVRYGRTTVTVRNPCPPGDHYEPPPLPGRRARN